MTIKEFVTESLRNFYSAISPIYQKKNDIVDNLTSTDTTNPLSANQGKLLNSKISDIVTNGSPLSIRVTFNETGWYRIASFGETANTTSRMGSGSYLPTITILRGYSNNPGEIHEFKICGVYRTADIIPLYNRSQDHCITKARLVVNSDSCAYIEVYYASSSPNTATIMISTPMDGWYWYRWNPCFSKTEESSDGFTVYTTANLPANEHFLNTKLDKITVIVGPNETKSTGISVNAGSYGKTYLVIASGHSAAGNETISEIGFIRCGYSGNNYSYNVLGFNGGSSTNNTSALVFSLSGDILQVSANYSVGLRVTFVPN